MKRFTETTKWDDPWYRKLSPKLKCLWQYVCDRCDGAGVIEMDYELAGFQIGSKVVDSDMLDLGGRVEKLPCGKWWVVRFVAFQYGKLSEECKAHGPVFASLDAYGLKERVSIGYAKGIHTLKEKEKETDKEKEEEKDKTAPTQKRKGTLEELRAYCVELGLPASDGEACFYKWEGNGWKNGDTAIKDWRSTVRSWKAYGYLPSQKVNGKPVPPVSKPAPVVEADPPDLKDYFTARNRPYKPWATMHPRERGDYSDWKEGR